MFIRLKGGKFHNVQGRRPSGTGARHGKKHETNPVLLLQIKFEGFGLKGRFEFDGDISTGFVPINVPIILVEIGNRYAKKFGISRNLPRFLVRSCALSFPLTE